MSKLIPDSFDFSSAANKFFDYLLFILDYVKGWMVHKFYETPYVGGLLVKLPLVVYGVFVVAVVIIVPYVAISILLAVKNRTTSVVMNSKVGDVIENRKLTAQAKRLARQKEYVQAADLFLTLNDWQSAAKVLEKGEDWEKAGKIYEKAGQFDKAIDLYKKAGDNSRLADCLKKKGDFKGAAEIFTQMGKKLMAAESYEKAGNYSKAAEFYEENGSLISAAECYEKAANLRKAAEMYEQGYVEATASQMIPPPEVAAKLKAMSRKAAAFFEQCGDYGKAAEVFARCKDMVQAAEVCLKGKDRAKAADYFILAKEYERAAEIHRQDGDTRAACEVMAEKYRQEGNISMAAKMYMDAGFFSHAAELFEQCGEYLNAGESFMHSAEYASAAMMFNEGGDKSKAAEAYIKAGDPQKAAQIYIQLDELDKATPLVEEAGDYVLAAELYRKQGMLEKEMAALQKVDSQDPRYYPAVVRLAEIFKDRGNLNLAAESYIKVIGGAGPGQNNLDLYYGLGTVYEAGEKFKDAAEIYQKILLVDFQFKDVTDRKKNCEMHISQPKAAQSAPGPASAAVAAGAAAPQGRQADASKRYAIVKELGRGGMGVVYLAKDNNLNRVVALKLFPKSVGDNPRTVERFVSETRSVSQLTHPNIAALYEFQQAGGRSFITMEYVEGATLKRLLSGAQKLPLVNILKVVYQCCQGLDYAHKKGIIHRDIKPSNIMINKQNAVKILDFGLARAAGEETLADAGAASVAAMYTSPEQLTGGEIDQTTDIYSLGVVFYEMLTGSNPFANGDAAYNHMHTEPMPPRQLRPELPEKLDQIVLTCLQKDRAKRFPSAAHLAMSLREVPLK